jgi:hypothetical protein
MEEKITIIEGPPPTFEMIPDLWVHGLSEGFNLEYRTTEWLKAEVPIIAARHLDTAEGDVLMLWLRFTDDQVELEIGYDDDLDEDDWDIDETP